MNLKTALTVLGAFAAATTTAMSAQAADIGLDFNPNPAVTSISAVLNGDFTVGWAFEDEIAADVVALGTWGGQPNTSPFYGIKGTVTVALWDSSGDLLASTTVDPNSPRSGTANQWVFGAIAPVLLTPGQTYYVGSHQTSFDAQDYVFGVNPVSIAPEISYLHNAGQIGFGFPSFTLSANDEHGFFGGNLLLVAASAPEPSSWALLLLGFGGLGATMRSRRRLAELKEDKPQTYCTTSKKRTTREV
jgi:hypothetical protein